MYVETGVCRQVTFILLSVLPALPHVLGGRCKEIPILHLFPVRSPEQRTGVVHTRQRMSYTRRLTLPRWKISCRTIVFGEPYPWTRGHDGKVQGSKPCSAQSWGSESHEVGTSPLLSQEQDFYRKSPKISILIQPEYFTLPFTSKEKKKRLSKTFYPDIHTLSSVVTLVDPDFERNTLTKTYSTT